ncbi:LysR family transcriptional regulator [Sphingomonas montanisoli]|uniref:LysR family transcriptional regulator n=1 Tax=Sphingomonas montanisoli TaxID=2606412 RepID=A0A5D9CFK4_9SPHN|nr:LysR family transcriptional regulator [Sphingomonas montanisoli]TZG28921.1 LysR family transcriptional regulator [Sphingomonas montanisoli]
MTDLVQALRTYADVAAEGSFSRVAERSGASHTTIARRIDFLEAHFGARLLHRSTRRLTLTHEGLRLLDHARTVIEAVDNARSELGDRKSARGVVRVGVTTALGLHYAGRLADLRARHPELRIEFAVADWQGELRETGLDLALRVGDPAPESLFAEPLGLIRRSLVATPLYLGQRGTPDGADDLREHECIAYGYGPAPSVWDVGGVQIPATGAFRANSSEAVYRAVTHDLGIGLLPDIQVAEAIAEGRLTRLLPGIAIEPLRLSVVHHFPGRQMPFRVRAVLDFLHRAFPGAGDA